MNLKISKLAEKSCAIFATTSIHYAFGRWISRGWVVQEKFSKRFLELLPCSRNAQPKFSNFYFVNSFSWVFMRYWRRIYFNLYLIWKKNCIFSFSKLILWTIICKINNKIISIFIIITWVRLGTVKFNCLSQLEQLSNRSLSMLNLS